MKKRRRCLWCADGNEDYIRYHDQEWGVASRSDPRHFEFLVLESAQAGLSWATVLNKRRAYREAFAGFDAEKVSRFGESEVHRLLGDKGINSQ